MNIEKVIRALPAGYADDAAGFDEDKLRDEILKASARIGEIEDERDADDKLNGAKDLVADLSAPYRDAAALPPRAPAPPNPYDGTPRADDIPF